MTHFAGASLTSQSNIQHWVEISVCQNTRFILVIELLTKDLAIKEERLK